MSRVWSWAGAVAALLYMSGTAEAQKEYRVSISSDPSGATVYLGAKDYGDELGETPYMGSLPAGDHTLTFVLEGYSATELDITVRKRRKRQKFRAELEELVTGVVEVSAPSGDAAVGAEVRIDGERVGDAPDEFDVEVGPHVVEVIVPGLDPYEEWIEVVEGQVVTVVPELGAADDDDDDDEDDEEDPTPKVRRKVSPRKIGEIGSALVVLDTALNFGGRHYSYKGDEQSDNLRPFKVDGAPLFHLGVELYPLAGHRTELLRGIGVAASLDRAVSMTSTTSDGAEVSTTWQQVEVGLRGRMSVGDATLVGATVSYGTLEVSFDTVDLMDETPEVKYKFIGLAVDGRYDEGRVGYFGGASLLIVSSAGTAADRFRDASTFGVGLHGGVAIGIIPKVEARVVGRYRMFSSTFASETTDTHFADGATDHIYGILFGAAYIY